MGSSVDAATLLGGLVELGGLKIGRLGVYKRSEPGSDPVTDPGGRMCRTSRQTESFLTNHSNQQSTVHSVKQRGQSV
jgi:hypothetical protein